MEKDAYILYMKRTSLNKLGLKGIKVACSLKILRPVSTCLRRKYIKFSLQNSRNCRED